eukprot:765043-Hanusia_phi.AAC.2
MVRGGVVKIRVGGGVEVGVVRGDIYTRGLTGGIGGYSKDLQGGYKEGIGVGTFSGKKGGGTNHESLSARRRLGRTPVTAAARHSVIGLVGLRAGPPSARGPDSRMSVTQCAGPGGGPVPGPSESAHGSRVRDGRSDRSEFRDSN